MLIQHSTTTPPLPLTCDLQFDHVPGALDESFSPGDVGETVFVRVEFVDVLLNGRLLLLLHRDLLLDSLQHLFRFWKKGLEK